MIRVSPRPLIATLGALALCTGANAALIDFNDRQGSDGDFTFDTPTDGPLGATGITVDFAGSINDSGSGTNHQGAYPIDAAEDYFFTNTSTGAVSSSITLEGLTGPAYDIVIYASIATDGGLGLRIGDYTVNGAFSDGGVSDDFDPFVDGFTNGTVMTWTNVTPIAGEITVEINVPAPATSVNTAVINALEFSVIPEPASLSLLAAGGLLIAGRRRRHEA